MIAQKLLAALNLYRRNELESSFMWYLICASEGEGQVLRSHSFVSSGMTLFDGSAGWHGITTRGSACTHLFVRLVTRMVRMPGL